MRHVNSFETDALILPRLGRDKVSIQRGFAIPARLEGKWRSIEIKVG
jgi:hypothetical protein